VCEPFVAALPPNHHLAGQAAFDLRELADEPFIHFPRREAPGLFDRMEELFHDHGFRPRVVQETTEWLTILALVEAGLGISVVPASFRKLQWGDLSYVDLHGTDVRTTIALCIRPGIPNPAARSFVQVANDVFAL
jgi:DNA-binding transcriptional LysR family regulator